MNNSSRLRIYPDHVLREFADPVKNMTDEIRTLSEEMILLMEEHHGIGLAAPQVGVLQRIIVVKDQETYLPLVNPELHYGNDKHQMEEGCLSLPGIGVNVTRDYSAVLSATQLSGDTLERKVEGFLARVIQHEIDHLNGILIIDRASALERHLLKKQLRQLSQQQQV